MTEYMKPSLHTQTFVAFPLLWVEFPDKQYESFGHSVELQVTETGAVVVVGAAVVVLQLLHTRQ